LCQEESSYEAIEYPEITGISKILDIFNDTGYVLSNGRETE
jgi:hypothetical protein